MRQIRQTNGKFQGPGIEQKIVDTHINALNGAIAAGIDPMTAHRIGDMAVRDMMTPPAVAEDPTQKNGGGRNRKVGMVFIGR